MEGCGVQCDNPMFTSEEHDAVHVAVGVGAAVCAICTLFTVVSMRACVSVRACG